MLYERVPQLKTIPGQGGGGREEHWQVLAWKVVPHGQVRTEEHSHLQLLRLKAWPAGQVADGSLAHKQLLLSQVSPQPQL